MAKKKETKESSGGKKEVDEGKAIAVISYITWVGLIIAIVLNMDKKNEFAKFHIRQSLLLMIAAIPAFIPFIGWIWGVFIFILWILGLISAINGEKKEVPVFGPLAQDWFKSI